MIWQGLLQLQWGRCLWECDRKHEVDRQCDYFGCICSLIFCCATWNLGAPVGLEKNVQKIIVVMIRFRSTIVSEWPREKSECIYISIMVLPLRQQLVSSPDSWKDMTHYTLTFFSSYGGLTGTHFTFINHVKGNSKLLMWQLFTPCSAAWSHRLDVT